MNKEQQRITKANKLLRDAYAIDPTIIHHGDYNRVNALREARHAISKGIGTPITETPTPKD